MDRAVPDADEVAHDDLRVAAACLRGEPAAERAVWNHIRDAARFAQRRLGLASHELDDIAQRVAAIALGSNAGRAPAIAGYRGRVGLGGWLRVIAVREAGRAHGRRRRELLGEDVGLAAAGAGGEVSTELAKAEYRAAFKQAFQAAVAGLPSGDRLVLRQHVLDGLSLDRLGQLHGVHRTSMARRIAKISEALRAGTIRRLNAALQVDVRDTRGAFAFVESRLGVSLERLLRESVGRAPTAATRPRP